MSLSTDNTGLVIFGTCDDGIPTNDGASFPTAAGQCHVTAKYKTGSKTKKASASGKNGAKTTYTGKQVGEVEIEISWLDDGEDTTEQVEAALLAISTAGPNAGKAWDWTERWAGLHKVGAVMVEDFEGPTPSKTSNEVSCKIKCSGWEKPVNSGAGTGTTPTTASPYNPNGTVKTPGFPGSENIPPLGSTPAVTP